MNKNVNRYFTEEDAGMADKNTKRCSTLLANGEKQIKITMGDHYIPIRMAKIKKTNNTKHCQEYGANGTLID